MSGCCRGLPAKVCIARPYGCSDGPTPDPARATRPRDGPELRVLAVPPEWLAEFEARVKGSRAKSEVPLHVVRMRELLRYVRALERERDDAGRGG
jgi:hypothetical protein